MVCRSRAVPEDLLRLRFDGPVLSPYARTGRGYLVHRSSQSCLDPVAIAKAVSARGHRVAPAMVRLG